MSTLKEHQGADTMRKTRVRRGGEIVLESALTPIRRAQRRWSRPNSDGEPCRR